MTGSPTSSEASICVESPPECELHDKELAYRGNAYCRNGVQGQISFQIEDEQVDWLALEGGSYLSLSAGEDGRIGSHVFPGLALDVEAFLEKRYDIVLAALQEQTGGKAHYAFIERLTAENGGT